MKSVGYLALAMTLVSSLSLAAGFKCEGELGYKAKLFNKTTGGTRTPAKLVISHEDLGTLLTASTKDIKKKNRKNSVQYVVDATGTKLDADLAILQIGFKEGRETLEEGEEVDGALIVVNDGTGDRDVFEMVCTRYKKNS